MIRSTLTSLAVSASLALAASLAVACPAAAQSSGGTQDAGFFVDRYDIIRKNNATMEHRQSSDRALLVVLRYWMTVDDVREGRGFTIFNHSRGGAEIPFQIVDIGGTRAPTSTSDPAFGWFLLEPASTSELKPGDQLELVIYYDQVDSWDRPSDGSTKQGPRTAKPVRVLFKKLDPQLQVNNRGMTSPASSGFSAYLGQDENWLDRLSFDLTPQVAEDSSELGVSYSAAFPLTKVPLTGDVPGTISFDFSLDGRWGSDSSDPSLTEFTTADLNLRAMLLPKFRDRYNPIGVRIAAGYEDGDQGSNGGITAQGLLVVSIPYIGEGLLWWQELIGFNRPFAPPFVSLGYVKSDAEVASLDQSRFVIEAGWVAPIAEEWDVNLRWQHFSFEADALDDDELFTADLTYYPGGNLSQGLRMSFEEGYRAAVGDVGSTVFLGYLIRL